MNCPFGQDSYFADVDAVIGFEDDVPMPGNRAVVFVCEALSDQRIMRRLFPVNRSVAEFNHVDPRDKGFLNCGSARVPDSNRQTVINYSRNRQNVYGVVDRDYQNWVVDHNNLIPTDGSDIEATLLNIGQGELIMLLVEYAGQIPSGFIPHAIVESMMKMYQTVSVSLQYCYRNHLLKEILDNSNVVESTKNKQKPKGFRNIPQFLDLYNKPFPSDDSGKEVYSTFFASLFRRLPQNERHPYEEFSYSWINGHLQVYSLVYVMKNNVELRNFLEANNIYLPKHVVLTSLIENQLTANEHYLRSSAMFDVTNSKVIAN